MSPVARLTDLGVLIRGVGYDPVRDLRARRDRDTVDLLRANNVQDGEILDQGVQYVHRRRVRQDQYLHLDDVLICAANGSKRLVGKAAPISSVPTRPMTFGAFMMTYRPDPAKVLPSFVAQQFRTKAYRDWVELLLAGSSINNLRPSDVGEFVFEVPPLDVQERTSGMLQDVDRLIAQLVRMIAKKEAIKLGFMQQLLTGSTVLSRSSTWSRSTVGDLSDVKTGPFGSALHESDYVRSGTPIITVEHLGDRGILARDVPLVSEADRRRLGAYALRVGDIVFSRVGAIDRNALVSERETGWLFSGRLLRVRFDRSMADPAFMSAQFHSQPFREAVRSVAVGQTMASLNTAILRGIEVDLPPIEEQVQIGHVVRDANRELDALDARLSKAKRMRSGMLQLLLRGRKALPGAEGGG